MFESVLIANRGEIAVRIARTLRTLGIRSVAVFSDPDRDARHVTDADEAIHIGPALAADSYLSVERIIDAALAAGVQALHPGYGFLSENVALARACADSGIVFVGPSVSAIEAMGDKIRAKATVSANGVQVVPGVSGVGLSTAELIEAAGEVGFPALIKPSAGGGGKGMRVVTAFDEWEDAIVSAKREARASFGDDTLLIERYIDRPRHIEVQVLADSHGAVVHLGERECSLQRRHQKVIEEAPSPLLSEELREVLGAQAVAAARACGYVNAGTVEFVVSGNDPHEAYFLEMNTRLQVEHPVTEMVWGIDLVEQQLRVAAGEPLGFAQDDLAPRGHAFEARIYAEDPSAGFLPTGGRVELLREAHDTPHVRVDSSLSVPMSVGSDYDPMLAKVIAWGTNRDEARRRLHAALANTVILGVVTNIDFLRRLLAQEDVVEGKLDTGLIDRLTMSQQIATLPSEVAVVAAVIAVGFTAGDGPWGDRHGWRIGGPAELEIRLRSNGESVTVRLRHISGSEWLAQIGDWKDRVVVNRNESSVEFASGSAVQRMTVLADFERVLLARDGATWSIEYESKHSVDHGITADTDLVIVSPMPGTVVGLAVSVGDTIEAGHGVAVIEAMKMEHTLRAPRRCVVRSVSVTLGERVSRHQQVVVLEAIQD